MYISRRGIMTDGGVPCSLATAIKTAVGAQATFTGYGKLAARTATQGECDLCGAGGKPLGVFVDCSPKGDSGTVETRGFVEVATTKAAPAVGDILTTGAAGVLVACVTPGAPTLGELTAGCWEVDEVISSTVVLIQIDARL